MKFAVRPSQIHGLGVFARRFIAKGDLVGRVASQNHGQLSKLKGVPKTGVVDERGDIWAVYGGYPLWYTNYSTEPNVAITPSGVYALRSIAQDDELCCGEFKAEVEAAGGQNNFEVREVEDETGA